MVWIATVGCFAASLAMTGEVNVLGMTPRYINPDAFVATFLVITPSQ